MKNIDERKIDLEDCEKMELEGLDLQIITVTCERQEVHSIPEKKIHLLKSKCLKSKHKEKVMQPHRKVRILLHPV
jgi:hypothetical protein